jgi:hypothetical protein
MGRSGVVAIGLLTPLIVLAVARCGGDENPAGGNAQGVGGAGASMAGSGGSTAGGSGGASTAGAGGASTAGAGGASTAGAGGGVVVGDGGPFSCEGAKPAAALITDFAAVDTAGAFTSASGISGRIFTYPATMTAVTKPALSMSGTVSGYSGFGIFLTQCVDASAYGGISFTIGGNVGTPATLMLQAKTNSTTPISPGTKHGACVAKDPNNTYADCWDPVARVDVPATAALVTVRWTDFKGGKPVDAVSPSEILGFQWSFNWAGATGIPYAADVTIDDIAFVQ